MDQLFTLLIKRKSRNAGMIWNEKIENMVILHRYPPCECGESADLGLNRTIKTEYML